RRVQDIHRRKTGALLRGAVRVGALVAGADGRTLRRLTAYGEHLGLAFQIADDILDAAGGPEADGRTDRELGKATYPGVLGLAGARAAAARAASAPGASSWRATCSWATVPSPSRARRSSPTPWCGCAAPTPPT